MSRGIQNGGRTRSICHRCQNNRDPFSFVSLFFLLLFASFFYSFFVSFCLLWALLLHFFPFPLSFCFVNFCLFLSSLGPCFSLFCPFLRSFCLSLGFSMTIYYPRTCGCTTPFSLAPVRRHLSPLLNARFFPWSIVCSSTRKSSFAPGVGGVLTFFWGLGCMFVTFSVGSLCFLYGVAVCLFVGSLPV